MIGLRFARLVVKEWGCETYFDDGTSFGSLPHDTHHYHVIAHRCGYEGDIMQYCIEHEFCHSFIEDRLHNRPSRILWGLAHGAPVEPYDAVYEEITTQTFQRWLRANERPIIGGVDWDVLKAEALNLVSTLDTL